MHPVEDEEQRSRTNHKKKARQNKRGLINEKNFDKTKPKNLGTMSRQQRKPRTNNKHQTTKNPPLHVENKHQENETKRVVAWNKSAKENKAKKDFRKEAFAIGKQYETIVLSPVVCSSVCWGGDQKRKHRMIKKKKSKKNRKNNNNKKKQQSEQWDKKKQKRRIARRIRKPRKRKWQARGKKGG